MIYQVSHDCKSLSENNIHPSSDEIIGIGIADVLMNHNKFFCGYCEASNLLKLGVLTLTN